MRQRVSAHSSAVPSFFFFSSFPPHCPFFHWSLVSFLFYLLLIVLAYERRNLIALQLLSNQPSEHTVDEIFRTEKRDGPTKNKLSKMSYSRERERERV